MKTLSISTRIDEPTKIAFTQVCDDIGISPSQAIQLFAKAVVNHGGIPFELKARQPTATQSKRSQLHPELSKISLNYDPTEPLSEDEWQVSNH